MFLVLVRIDCSVSVYFVQVQVQLALERVHRMCKCDILRQIDPWGGHFVEKEMWLLKKALGSFPDVRLRKSWNGCLPPVIF